MATSKFTPANRETFAALTEDGLTIADAARVTGIGEKTAKRWLARGRRETSGEYRDFADAVERAREARDEAEPPLDQAELKAVVSRAARKGSVQAMKLRWEMLRAEELPAPEPDDPFAELDRFDIDRLKKD